MKIVPLLLLCSLSLGAMQNITININGKMQQINYIECKKCGCRINARQDYFLVFDPYSDGEVYYLCEDCSLEYKEELSYQEKEEHNGE